MIFLLWCGIYVSGMFTPALLDDADSVHAEAAREMLLTHDWVTLHIDNGVRYLEKAPLMYWAVAASYRVFGVKDWSTRLPLMLGMLALFFTTYALGARAYGEQGGMYSAVVLATSVGPYLFTRFLIPDMLVTLWLTLSLFLFLRSLDESPPRRTTCWGFAAACALNVLTKGLIGLVFPVAIIFLYLLLTGNLRHLLKLRMFSSALVFLGIAAPWHILAALRNPDQGAVRGFLWFYFVNEHFLRYLNKRVPRDYDTVPLLVYWALVSIWLVPWVVFVPQAVRRVPVRWQQLRARMSREPRANLLFAIWSAVVLLFFGFSTRQEYYTLPALPGLALLIGGWLQEECSGGTRVERRQGRISSAVLAVIGVLAFGVGLTFITISKVPPPGSDLADLLKKNPQDYALSFGHFFDLTPQSVGLFHGPLLGVTLALFLGTGWNWFLRKRGRPDLGNAALAGMMVVLLVCVHSALIIFSPILSSNELADAVKKDYKPGDIIVVDGEYESASTLNFYTGLPLRILHEPSANLWYGSRFPDSPHVFETEETFRALWNGTARVFLWTDEQKPKALTGEREYVVARKGGKSILTNQPLTE
jgi:4-amino-4-deoxy-L-arabinose transferase-like glycosyltransferase